MGIGFEPRARPTARAADGWPIFLAIAPYVDTSPYGIFDVCFRTSLAIPWISRRSTGSSNPVRPDAKYSSSSRRQASVPLGDGRIRGEICRAIAIEELVAVLVAFERDRRETAAGHDDEQLPDR